MDDPTLVVRVALGVASLLLGIVFVLRRDAIAGRPRHRRGPGAQTATPVVWAYAGGLLAVSGAVHAAAARPDPGLRRV